jgi:hypothetical protein
MGRAALTAEIREGGFYHAFSNSGMLSCQNRASIDISLQRALFQSTPHLHVAKTTL